MGRQVGPKLFCDLTQSWSDVGGGVRTYLLHKRRHILESTPHRHLMIIPGPRDEVTVHYTGWRAENGEMFDSSRTRGSPATFPLDGVIPGWTEGLQLMVVGEQRRLWIPGNLAYDGRPGRPQGMLVFDVELLAITPAQ